MDYQGAMNSFQHDLVVSIHTKIRSIQGREYGKLLGLADIDMSQIETAASAALDVLLKDLKEK
jgi:hypothetical protein